MPAMELMFAADDHMTVRSDWRSLDFVAERHFLMLSSITAIRARLKHDCLALGPSGFGPAPAPIAT
jgi:hypothetical protein